MPLYRSDEDNPFGSSSHPKNVPSLSLSQYRRYMFDILQNYNIEILDIKDQFGKAEGSDLYADHVHPNDKGHQKLAELIADYIRKRLG